MMTCLLKQISIRILLCLFVLLMTSSISFGQTPIQNKWKETTKSVDITTLDKYIPTNLGTLQKINTITNRGFLYKKDTSAEWLTPKQFVDNGGGDCEDFVIYKYYAIIANKIPVKKMDLIVVFDSKLNDYHALLRVINLDGSIVYLDNQQDDLIKDDLSKTRYVFIGAL